MAITFVAASTSTQGTNNSDPQQGDKPVGVAEGDLMLAFVGTRISSIGITPPSGWTLLKDSAGLFGTTYSRTAIYYRFATASEPASWNWDLSAAAQARCDIVAYRGVHTTKPFYSQDTWLINTSISSVIGIPPFVVPNACMVIGHAYMTNYYGNWSTVAGSTSTWNTRVNRGTSDGGAGGFFLVDKSYSAKEGQSPQFIQNAATGSSNGNIGHLVLRPADEVERSEPHVTSMRVLSEAPDSTTVPLPHGAEVGDLVTISWLATKGDPTPTVPAGWTTILAMNTGSNPPHGYILGRVVQSGDTSVALSELTSELAFMMLWKRAAMPTEAAETGFDAATTTPVAPSVTGSDGATLLSVVVFSDDNVNMTTPAGMSPLIKTYDSAVTSSSIAESDQAATNGPLNIGMGFAEETLTAAGATGTRTWTLASTETSRGISVVIPSGNEAPNAPGLVSPVGNVVFDRANAQQFDWTFSDPDSGDSQSQYELRYRLAGDVSWIATVAATSVNTYHDFTGGTFAAGDYEWQVRTADSFGVFGPWSSSAFFTAGNAPATPTITDPINGSTVSTESRVLEWSTPSQTHYQVRKVEDNAGSPNTAVVYSDTGEVASTGTRTRTLTFPVNNRYEHLQVRIKSGGLWSSWASIRIYVSYTVPMTPTLVVINQPEDGRNRIEITNPAPVGDAPALVENYLYRRLVGEADWMRIAEGLLSSAAVYDYTAAALTDYEYKVKAIGDNGTSKDSNPVAATQLDLVGAWLQSMEDESSVRHFAYNDTGGDDDYEEDMTLIQYAGRTLPVAEYGEVTRHVISVELTAEVDNGDHEALRSLLLSRSILCYRDSYGRKAFFAPSGFKEKRRRWGSRIPLNIVDTDYDESV